MQPGEPVGAGHGDDSAVREVDDPQPLGEEALLAHGVAVVGGDALVEAVRRDGSRRLQQW